MVRRNFVALFLVLASAAQAAGLTDDPDPAHHAVCAAAGKEHPPATDLPTATQVQALVGCDPAALYAGVDGRPDYVKARLCAMTPGGLEGDPHVAHIDGDEVLIEIYANGFGVPRNLDLAIAYACSDDNTARAEFSGRLDHLIALRRHPQTKRFDYCDDITSGYMEGACADLQSRVADHARNLRLARLASALPMGAQAAYRQAERAAFAYAKSVADDETDLSGTGRAAFAIAARDRVRDAFVRRMADLAGGRWPRASPARARAAVEDLNAAYVGALADVAPGTDDARFTTVAPAGIEKTQIEWLTYRDAFVRLAEKAQRPVDADSVIATLSRERASVLRH